MTLLISGFYHHIGVYMIDDIRWNESDNIFIFYFVHVQYSFAYWNSLISAGGEINV